MLTYEDLIQRVITWAESNSAVRAALLLGSRARTNHPADEWSDLDVLVFAENPDQFIQSSDWVKTIAPFWLTFIERAGDGESWERRTLFEGGLDVDLAFNTPEWLDGIQGEIPPIMVDIVRRGVKVLVDKDGNLARVLSMPMPDCSPSGKPSQHDFNNAVSDFWYHTLWSARHLRRGELWWAKSCVDMYLQGLLRQMLEWHAHALKGDGHDTWMRGRFLEEWADPRAVDQLKNTFAHYDAKDTARALRATMDLFRWLEDETVEKWGFSIPIDGEQHAARVTLHLLDTM
jgi:aminoglycoside 6-adenylyltransferase